MQSYQFNKIFSIMEKEFGKINKGEEDAYAMMLMPLEGNVLKIHRRFPTSNSRRLREAIALTLFDIKEKYTGESVNLDSFRSEDNSRLEHALLMAFDPLTNEEVEDIIKDQTTMDLSDRRQLYDYYEMPVRCLLRIKESIDLWEKHMGSDGYFDFIEQHMGDKIQGDKMISTFSLIM